MKTKREGEQTYVEIWRRACEHIWNIGWARINKVINMFIGMSAASQWHAESGGFEETRSHDGDIGGRPINVTGLCGSLVAAGGGAARRLGAVGVWLFLWFSAATRRRMLSAKAGDEGGAWRQRAAAARISAA